MSRSGFEFTLFLYVRSEYNINNWCSETFGPTWNVVNNRDGKWACRWDGHDGFGSKYRWNFKQETDAIIFTLKWIGRDE
jgi:hypothetical protein